MVYGVTLTPHGPRTRGPLTIETGRKGAYTASVEAAAL